MLDKGKDLDWFNSPTIVVMLVVTVIAFAAWLIWELTEKQRGRNRLFRQDSRRTPQICPVR
jgi:hypothetical protein